MSEKASGSAITGGTFGGAITFTSGAGFPEDLRYVNAGKISFCIGAVSNPVLVLDHEGMIYMGERVEDAGAAHRAFMTTIGAFLIGQNPQCLAAQEGA